MEFFAKWFDLKARSLVAEFKVPLNPHTESYFNCNEPFTDVTTSGFLDHKSVFK